MKNAKTADQLEDEDGTKVQSTVSTHNNYFAITTQRSRELSEDDFKAPNAYQNKILFKQ